MIPHLSSERYASPERYERERQAVFHASWMAVCRVTDLSRPGDAVPFDAAGVSVFVVLGDDGRIRAFRNACRHRGTRLVCATRRGGDITCRYHGWAYDGQGRLIRVPDESGFPGLRREDYGLSSVRCETWGGFVWVTVSDITPPLVDYLGAVADGLAPYGLEHMRRLARRTWTLACNWKAFLDNNSERYHVPSVHPRWARALAVEDVEIAMLGRHHLFSVSLGNYAWRARLDRWTMPRGNRVPADLVSRYQRYLIFPNLLVSVTPHQMTVFRIFPEAVDRCRFEYEFFVPASASPLLRLRARLAQRISERIMEEDNAILASVQRGLTALPSTLLPLHFEERGLAHFHGVVDALVAEGEGRSDNAMRSSPAELSK